MKIKKQNPRANHAGDTAVFIWHIVVPCDIMTLSPIAAIIKFYVTIIKILGEFKLKICGTQIVGKLIIRLAAESRK
ncbi:MAG: hypothetical protein WA103_01800 [Minisyncoccales bacterium]